MLNVEVTVEGKSLYDVVEALKEATRKIEGGYRSGMDSNEDGEYNFSVSGDEEDSDGDEEDSDDQDN